MGFFSALGRRSPSPHEATQLWTLLAPLGGRTTPDAVRRWSGWARSQPEETLAEAAAGLRQVYTLLDTEQHARALAVEPFSGIGRPFARRRFLRVLDQVILAGPDAVEQVAGVPERVRSHDTVDLLDPGLSLGPDDPAGVNLSSLLGEARVLRGTQTARVADLPEPELGAALQAMVRLDGGGAPDDWSTSGRWPSLRSAKASQRLRFTMEDVEVAWIEVAVSVPAEAGRGADGGEGDTGWTAAGRQAALEVYRALGGAPGAQHDLSHRRVCIEVVTADDAEGGPAVPEVGEAEPVVLIELVLDVDELAVVDPQARAALLVRRSAERLTRAALPWGESSRTALVALAAGQAV